MKLPAHVGQKKAKALELTLSEFKVGEFLPLLIPLEHDSKQ